MASDGRSMHVLVLSIAGIAAVLMGIWGGTLVGGIFLLRPDTRQPTGVLMVLAVPILFVSALPIVYRYWVKNWHSM